MTKFENKISPRIHVCHDLNTSEMSLSSRTFHITCVKRNEVLDIKPKHKQYVSTST